MITVVAGILMLGVLVFVHELGHFVVAKLCGVKVLEVFPRFRTEDRCQAVW